VVAPLPKGKAKFPRKPQQPTAAQQKARLDQRFLDIVASFAQVETSVSGVEPEQVIVLEAVDSVEDVAKAAENIPGMEWLSELDLEDADPEFGFQYADEKDAAKKLPQRLYAVMTNQAGMNKLLALWNSWTTAPADTAVTGFGPFKNLFLNLRDIRRWNHNDRLHDTGILEEWHAELEYQTETLHFEIELWHREQPAVRQRSSTTVRTILSRVGGNVLQEFALPEIRYHGLLVTVPGQRIQEVLDSLTNKAPVELVRCHDVMFFRPHGQARVSPAGRGEPPATTKQVTTALPTGNPVVAMLDGLPLANHTLLTGRIVIDDPDDQASRYSSQHQQHGTAMASLIAHGDLAADESPIDTPIYVRPILEPDRQEMSDGQEITPPDRLIVDLIHQAIRRIKEGDGTEPAVAPSVRVVNLSIGIPSQPFLRYMSPLARLIDWLSWKYGLLFVVSAGNYLEPLVLQCTNGEWDSMDDAQKRKAVLMSIRAQRPNRQPLSPAESLNCVTVGSCHHDASQRHPLDRRVDVFDTQTLPSPFNPIASGFRRSVSPDVMLPGGRLMFDRKSTMSNEQVRLHPNRAQAPPGNHVAVAGTKALELGRVAYTRGTSNAAALSSRLGALIHERLMLLRNEPFGDRLTDDCLAVLIKAMLVHEASWDAAADILDSAFRDALKSETGSPQIAAHQLRKLKAAFLGYGAVSADKCLFSTDERITFIGCSKIDDQFSHTYRFPLPGSLAGKKVKRRTTYTLAWLTPINLRHNRYRRAKLQVEWPTDDPLELKVADTAKTDGQRGTVEHHVREGAKNVAFGDAEWLDIKVICKADAGTLSDSIPYALAVSLEIAEPLEESIYEEIRVRLRPRIDVPGS